MDRQGEGRRSPTGGQAPLAVLLVVASMLVLLGFFIHGDYSAPPVAEQVAEVSSTTSTTVTTVSSSTSTTVPQTTTTAGLLHPIGDPRRVVIPAIGVDASIVSIGLLPDGIMETPRPGKVGWYSLGAAPGEQGPSVLIGHVDNTSGADVFYRLKLLEPGDEVFVYGDGDDPAVFVVDTVEQQLKIDLPSDRIWSETNTSLIRLITCGGQFDRTSRHYLSNVIVYGHLVR